jgi:hypothetical protein
VNSISGLWVLSTHLSGARGNTWGGIITKKEADRRLDEVIDPEAIKRANVSEECHPKDGG